MTTPTVHLVLALHNHQPVGNFDHVFEEHIKRVYNPFMDVLDQHAKIPFALHYSGPLWEWMTIHCQPLIQKISEVVKRGQIELMGGPYAEPILTMIPTRDRIGQITRYSKIITRAVGTAPRGIWLPERVWEQSLVPAIRDSNMDYTILDENHFLQAGLNRENLNGYYITEDEGRTIALFPADEKLRYLIPFADPEETTAYLQSFAEQHGEAVIVYADDGEKFGGWPETYKHVYEDGWLERFFQMLEKASSWLHLTTFSWLLEHHQPWGKIYIPDNSYTEMGEWSLPPTRAKQYSAALKDDRFQDTLIRGGFWRNFKYRYPEADRMYCRMMEVSEHMAALPHDHPNYEKAQKALYNGQCNCPYWHGVFGGLYLPHLRHAIYQHLIQAENFIRDPHSAVGCQVKDFDLDGADEAKLFNPVTSIYMDSIGGRIYEMDWHEKEWNILCTLAHRIEAYHDEVPNDIQQDADEVASIHSARPAKEAGLRAYITEDGYCRDSLIDHYWDAEENRPWEQGEKGRVLSNRMTLVHEKQGIVFHDKHDAPVAAKQIHLDMHKGKLEVRYDLRAKEGHLGVEWNMAMPSATSEATSVTFQDGDPTGVGDPLWQPGCCCATLTDHRIGASLTLVCPEALGMGLFPIYTVSQSESGYEKVYQSSVLMPVFDLASLSEGLVMRLEMSSEGA